MLACKPRWWHFWCKYDLEHKVQNVMLIWTGSLLISQPKPVRTGRMLNHQILLIRHENAINNIYLTSSYLRPTTLTYDWWKELAGLPNRQWFNYRGCIVEEPDMRAMGQLTSSEPLVIVTILGHVYLYAAKPTDRRMKEIRLRQEAYRELVGQWGWSK